MLLFMFVFIYLWIYLGGKAVQLQKKEKVSEIFVITWISALITYQMWTDRQSSNNH